jgi:hypothetical protein
LKKLYVFKWNKPEFVCLEEKPLILQIILTFQKQLQKPLFRGHLWLSNGISPSRIGFFLYEIWPKKTKVLMEVLSYGNLPYSLPGVLCGQPAGIQSMPHSSRLGPQLFPAAHFAVGPLPGCQFVLARSLIKKLRNLNKMF